MAELAFEPATFRKALGSFATGVTIVTTEAAGERFGVTANSFNSVSLDPPMILWSLAKTSASLAAFSGAPGFAVHVLARDQEELSNRFARKGMDKFAGLTLESAAGGIPLLTGCAARFECRTTYRYEGGDHIIFVGEVTGFSHGDKEPLLFHAGRYASAARHEANDPQPDLPHDLQADDLTYLVASSYFQLLSPVRRRAAYAGLSLSDHHALNVVVARGECPLTAINDVVGHLGLGADLASMRALEARGLVAIREATATDALVSPTPAGRALMIELIAAAKAREADAQLEFGEEDARLLKRLLRRLVRGLAEREDEGRVTRHMDLMRSVTRTVAGTAT